MESKLVKVYENISNNAPLVHNITNYVTVNDCANIELAFGGSPIMADDVSEVEEVVSYASSLVINMGTLNHRTMESMKVAAKKANEENVPIVFDPVGCGFTGLRKLFSKELIEECQLAVVRGNLSEIMALINEESTGKGVDVSDEDAGTEIDRVIKYAKTLASQLACLVIVTGVEDVITDGEKVAICKNGDKMMSKVTGTGCMLTAMLGVSVGANPKNIFEACVYAVSSMGVAGEKGAKYVKEHDLGTSSLRRFIIDDVSKATGMRPCLEADYELR